MKNVFFGFLICFVASALYGQSANAFNSSSCDSLFLTDGTVKLVQVMDTIGDKLSFRSCCEGCNVTRKINLSKVLLLKKAPVQVISEQEESTTLQNFEAATSLENQGDNQAEISNSNEPANPPKAKKTSRSLVFTQKNGGERSLKLKEGQRMALWTTTGEKVKGSLHINDSSSIMLNENSYLLSEITQIAKPMLITKLVVGVALVGSVVTCGVLGLLITSSGVGAIVGGALGLGTSMATVPLISIKRKLNLENDWNVRVQSE